jgi:hypothetical protein
MNLKQRVEAVVKRAKASKLGARSNGSNLSNVESWISEQREIATELDEINTLAGSSLAVGRSLKFQVADGYAVYLVTKVRKQEVVVAHVDVGDGYTFAGVYVNSKAELVIPRQVAQRSVEFDTFLKKMF